MRGERSTGEPYGGKSTIAVTMLHRSSSDSTEKMSPTFLLPDPAPDFVPIGMVVILVLAVRASRIAHREVRAPRFAVLDVCALERGCRAMGGSIDDVTSFRSLYRSTRNSSGSLRFGKSKVFAKGVPLEHHGRSILGKGPPYDVSTPCRRIGLVFAKDR